MPKYSIIAPVYNRRDEIYELLYSLSKVDTIDFEILLIDGSPDPILEEVDHHVKEKLPQLAYTRHHIPKLGISESRNLGAKEAKGEFLIFFDSDVIVPSEFFQKIEHELTSHKYDLFGGPDKSHTSFNVTQKAISYCMTGILTTGGIRGRNVRVGSFKPRGFNMGIRKSVFEEIGGFDLTIKVGEDIDLSARVIENGYSSGLIADAFVYHKRRVSLSKFYRQVFRFGAARILLARKHTGEMKITHLFPLIFTLGFISGPLLMFNPMLFRIWGVGISTYLLANSIIGGIQNRSVAVGLMIIPTILTQFFAYAHGFVKNCFSVFLLGKKDGIFESSIEGPDSPE